MDLTGRVARIRNKLLRRTLWLFVFVFDALIPWLLDALVFGNRMTWVCAWVMFGIGWRGIKQ